MGFLHSWSVWLPFRLKSVVSIHLLGVLRDVENGSVESVELYHFIAKYLSLSEIFTLRGSAGNV